MTPRVCRLLTSFDLQPGSRQVPPASLVISQAGVVDLVSAYEANLGQGAVRDFLGSSAAWTARFFVEPSAIGGFSMVQQQKALYIGPVNLFWHSEQCINMY